MNATLHHRAATLHRELLAVVADQRAADHRCAVLLFELAKDQLYRQLGHTSVVAYAVEVLGLTVRRTRDLLAIGRRLPELPLLSEAFAAGDVGWTKVREVVRVATPATEAAWVDVAKKVNNRELELRVGLTHVGDLPPEDGCSAEKGPSRVRMVFELEASDAQVVRDAIALVRAQSGVNRAEVEDGALLAMIAGKVLAEAPAETAPTGERYRIVLEHCPGCASTCGREHEVSETVALESRCDVEVVDGRPGATQGRLARSIPPSVRRAVVHRDRERCRAPGCRCRLWLDVHHVKPRHLGGTHTVENLVTLCPAHHRMVHEGVLGIEAEDGELRFRTARTAGP